MTTTTKPVLRAHRPMSRTALRSELERTRESLAMARRAIDHAFDFTTDVKEATQVDEAPAYTRSRAS